MSDATYEQLVAVTDKILLRVDLSHFSIQTPTTAREHRRDGKLRTEELQITCISIDWNKFQQLLTKSGNTITFVHVERDMRALELHRHLVISSGIPQLTDLTMVGENDFAKQIADFIVKHIPNDYPLRHVDIASDAPASVDLLHAHCAKRDITSIKMAYMKMMKKDSIRAARVHISSRTPPFRPVESLQLYTGTTHPGRNNLTETSIRDILSQSNRASNVQVSFLDNMTHSLPVALTLPDQE
ncbi:hypothetical protein HDV00_003945 [Rhizophlyctis rosea]|nr:hypothetical protein HDV00_003945 [Rhizophlyctis rosea]